ncbi:MAG TPA: hypothetical protein VE863_09625 [Pyrinomonadaceae bacterium]|jgi:hypothetical protein|nr:hypothetical protein [Pyrinomonadaceae bacterium]
MAKTFLYRLFGVGKMPPQWRATIESEGVVLMDEGIAGSLTYRDFRSSGKRFGWRKVAFTGAIALTRSRLLALQYANPAINVPFSDERFKQLRISVEGEETLVVAFDPSLFHNDWSGTMEYRFHTSEAKAFQKALSDPQ